MHPLSAVNQLVIIHEKKKKRTKHKNYNAKSNYFNTLYGRRD